MQMRQRYSKLKIVRMTALSVIAFVLSWSPYCFVSLAAVFSRKLMITSGEAEVPELLAKASVIYNPIVYTIKNSRFRATLFRILHVRRRRIQVQGLTLHSRSQCSFQNGGRCHDNNIGQSQLRIQVLSLTPRSPIADRV